MNDPDVVAAGPDEVRFAILHEDGTESDVRVISRSDILRCPHAILVPDHYRDDGSCRCDDPLYREMRDWGYRWNGQRWVGEEE